MKKETVGLHGLSIGYRAGRTCHQVAEGLNASLWSGELTCLLGSNGVGKSTLLRTLAGFQPPLAGEITPIGMLTTRDLAKEVSVVLTSKPDSTMMSVEEMVAMGRFPYSGFWGRRSQKEQNYVDEAIRLVGIEVLRNRQFASLSDGEKQKVMIAKALAQQTPILLLDEPTAYLDYGSKVEILLLLKRMAHELNKTIFLSTHDMELALQLADKLWLMEREKDKVTLHVGTPRELADDGTLSLYINKVGSHFDPESLRISVL